MQPFPAEPAETTYAITVDPNDDALLPAQPSVNTEEHTK